MSAPLRGRIVAFSDDAGFGTVETPDGQRYFFHCTQIADGSRTIDVDIPVSFDVMPGHLGQWEATSISAESVPH